MKSPYEKYELVASVKVGFNLERVEDLMTDLVNILAYHGVLTRGDKFKVDVVADHIAIVVLYQPGEGGVC